MLFSISNVKAYDFSSTNSSLSKFYFHAIGQDNSTYIDLAGNFNTIDYNQITLTEEIIPASRLVLKLYRTNFNFFGNTDYKISFYMKASFDVSTLGNAMTFRLCENDYTCTITDYDSFFVEEVEENLYKITTVFGANVTLPQVVSFWFDDVNVSAGDYYGIYKYFDYEVYDPSVEPEEPVEPEEENYIYIPQMPNYPISTTLIDSYMKNKIDLSIYNNVFYETCYENGSRYFWAYYMPSSNDFSYNNSTGTFTINPVTNGTFYRVMFTVNSTGTITGMSSVETWNQSLDFRYVSDTSKRLYFSTFNIYDPSGNLLIEGFEKEEQQFFTFRELDFNPHKTNEIIFDYKIPTGKTSIDFDLDYSIKSDIDTSPNLPIPTLKITYESGAEDVIYLNSEGEESNSYIGHYISCLGSGETITNLQLIIDLKGVAELVDIEFTSNFDFDVTYTDKVLPTFTYTLSKDETYNYMQVNFTFHNWTDENYKWVISSTETYQHDRVIASINSDMKNYSLYANTTETMYVSLYYKDTPLSTEIIDFSDLVEDYFTKEEIDSIQKEETFRKEDYENMKDVMNSNKNFIQQLAPITEFFKEIFEHMFGTLPSQVRYLLIFMFSISLLVGIAWWLK